MSVTWKTQIELPAIRSLSDDSPWVTLRGTEFEDRDSAVAAFNAAKAEHEFPLRFIKSVSFGDQSSAEQFQDPTAVDTGWPFDEGDGE